MLYFSTVPFQGKLTQPPRLHRPNTKATLTAAFVFDGDGADHDLRSGFDEHRDSDTQDVAQRATGSSTEPVEGIRLIIRQRSPTA